MHVIKKLFYLFGHIDIRKFVNVKLTISLNQNLIHDNIVLKNNIRYSGVKPRRYFEILN